MDREPAFIGRKYSDDELADHREFMHSERAKGMEKLPGEEEKTPEELEIIDLANTIIAVWLDQKGIPYERLAPERVHILSEKSFATHETDPLVMGEYDDKIDGVILKKESAETSATLLALLIHEMLHRAHVHKYFAHESGEIGSVRSGYNINSFWKNGQQKMHGFNEAVLVYTSFEILNSARGFLEDTLGIPAQEWSRGDLYPYMRYAQTLELIARGISENDSPDNLEKAYDKIVRGQFSNTILNLKDIEYAFGRGSLQVLSLLMSRSDEMGEHLDNLINKYFAEPRDKERAELGNLIQTLARDATPEEDKRV